MGSAGWLRAHHHLVGPRRSCSGKRGHRHRTSRWRPRVDRRTHRRRGRHHGHRVFLETSGHHHPGFRYPRSRKATSGSRPASPHGGRSHRQLECPPGAEKRASSSREPRTGLPSIRRQGIARKLPSLGRRRRRRPARPSRGHRFAARCPDRPRPTRRSVCSDFIHPTARRHERSHLRSRATAPRGGFHRRPPRRGGHRRHHSPRRQRDRLPDEPGRGESLRSDAACSGRELRLSDRSRRQCADPRQDGMRRSGGIRIIIRRGLPSRLYRPTVRASGKCGSGNRGGRQCRGSFPNERAHGARLPRPARRPPDRVEGGGTGAHRKFRRRRGW